MKFKEVSIHDAEWKSNTRCHLLIGGRLSGLAEELVFNFLRILIIISGCILISSFAGVSAGRRDKNVGMQPSSNVKTDTKYSFKRYTFSSSEHIILPSTDFSGAIPFLLDSLLLINL